VDQLVEKLLSLSPRPQGVFLPSDNVAKLVHDALVARGVQPGRDITLIGCNNEDGILASIDPRPATIALECVEVGRQAVQRLLWRIQNPYAPPVLMEVAPRLVPPPVESAGELVVLNDLVLNA
jgi:LacI family transcriptional regulator